VLPPDTLCIYSEDRQFFLHGELDCALASAIGTEGRSYRDLVRELEPDCACEEVMEAMKRLFHRGYIIGTSHEAPSRPWQLIGQALAWHQKSQREIFGDVMCAFNRYVRGEAELGASPRELALRVMERSPTLTVAMVNDYLEASLFDLNQ
jgi:oxazoline/thiazoline synthase